MKYLKVEGLSEAECANDALKPSELLESKLKELQRSLEAPGLEPLVRAKYLLDAGYILLDLERRDEAWALAREAFDLALSARDWLKAVEACDVLYQAEQGESIKALAHGIWLAVTYPVDPELTVAMLQHFVEETPETSDGAAVAASVASYVVALRAEGKQREDLQFFTSQLLGTVARRHTNGTIDSQELFEFWVERMELDDPAKFLPRMSQIIDLLVDADWWFDRDVLREQLPQE